MISLDLASVASWPSTRCCRVAQADTSCNGSGLWVNMCRATSYLSPFGGDKQSGFGHENGQTATYEYLQEKSVWIDAGNSVPPAFVQR